MDLKDILALNVPELDAETKETVYNLLVNSNADQFPKKVLRKILELSLSVIAYKGDQVISLQEQIEVGIQGDAGDESIDGKLIEENEKLNRTVSKLETEKLSLKVKVTELTDEIVDLQRRIQEITAAESDKDTSDPLSEIDRKEELLRNISTKNKHIKRLLRDIEELELQNVEQSNIVFELEEQLQRSKIDIEEIQEQLLASKGREAELNENVDKLNEEISRLEGNINYLEDEREKSEEDLKQFIQNLEQRAFAWRCSIDEKEEQLMSLQKKYEELYQQNSTGVAEYNREAEVKQLVDVLHEKDSIIEELESKLRSMAEEMVSSTKLMNKISSEREEEKNQNKTKTRTCCKHLKSSLVAANARCKELSEMLETVEEDNLLKAKQAFDALSALQAYEKGEDGLAQALRKVSELQKKLSTRETQIKALVVQSNSLSEINQENSILRKRLNIPDDVVVVTTNLAAKQKSKDKMLERLNLKLRASEEMRLQLQIEKSELKKQMMRLRKSVAPANKEGSIKDENDSPKPRGEIYCDNCLKHIKTLPNPNSVVQEVVKEWKAKYAGVIEENENLRVGMHEILEKIREYDASSDHITIDCSILEKVLHALDARSISGWYHPAMRMQNELIAVKEREHALRQRVNLAEKVQLIEREVKDIKNTDNLYEVTSEQISIEQHPQRSNREKDIVRSESSATFIIDENHDEILIPQLEEKEKKSIVHSIQQDELYPLLAEKDAENLSARQQLNVIMEKYREMLLVNEELKVYQAQFEELSDQMKQSENDLTKYCADLVDKFTEQERKLQKQLKVYEFLKDDFDQTLVMYKNSESANIILIADLKKQLNDKKHELNLIRSTEMYRVDAVKGRKGDFSMQKQLYRTQALLALIVEKLFSGKLPESIVKLDDKEFMDYGIISENFEINYITTQEYEKMQLELNTTVGKYEEMKAKCSHLEQLHIISQEQIKSQQNLLSGITDNHIDLRHLVADLQSNSEDKFLISKAHRDLELTKNELNQLKAEKEKLEGNFFQIKKKCDTSEQEIRKMIKEHKDDMKNNDIKLQFLEKSLSILREKYCKFTPLVPLVNFITMYANVLKESRRNEDTYSQVLKDLENTLLSKLAAGNFKVIPQDIVNLVKYESKCSYLENMLAAYSKKTEALQTEVNDLKIISVEEKEHWKTIQALFGSENKMEMVHKSMQCSIESKTVSTDTEDIFVEQVHSKKSSPNGTPTKLSDTIIKDSLTSSPLKQSLSKAQSILSLESQLKQAMNLASMRSALLLETENRLAEAQGRIKEMEKNLEGKKQLLKQEIERTSNAEEKAFQKSSGMIESTMSSLQSLLSEKDHTLSHYQELLKTEREQHTKSCDNYEKEKSSLKKTISDLQNEISAKEIEMLEMKSKTEKESSRGSSKDDLNLADELHEFEKDEKHFNEMSDEKIEEMFFDESKNISPRIFGDSSRSQDDVNVKKQIQQMHIQIREAKSREVFWEKSVRARDEEISLLKEKLTFIQEREKLETNPSETDQLKIILEEKDKQISDLMEMLTSFHDDQQRYMSETTLYSADQMSQLGADLSRSENTNKILNTQVEALRRQIASLTQREKQARDLANSLKTQLIKRPVIPVKTESNTRKTNEQLQKKLIQLETELQDSKEEIKKLQNIIETRKARNVTEINLWEKQKRWQQNAEKLKSKLIETETALEKTRNMLSVARTTLEKVEKEKYSLESKLKANTTMHKVCLSHSTIGSNKCCRTPSCPNLLTKYTYSESPESFLDESDNGSPVRRIPIKVGFYEKEQSNAPENSNKDLINALRSRIESQQRKIVALEMDGKDINPLIKDYEKLQEKLSALEAENIRSEAKNLQLQLDLDLLRQGDGTERLQKRVDHLEEYISVLKKDLTRAEEQKSVGNQLGEGKVSSQPEQTILALRRIIEKLKVENKNLKDGRKYFDSGSKRDGKDTSASEISRLQHLYAEALDKISSLQIELQLKSGCCINCREKRSNNFKGAGDLDNELKLVKDQLVKKSQLLEKAKILLTRAAAKEKHLKEQLDFWKRKCSELQNVPVIEEISE